MNRTSKNKIPEKDNSVENRSILKSGVELFLSVPVRVAFLISTFLISTAFTVGNAGNYRLAGEDQKPIKHRMHVVVNTNGKVMVKDTTLAATDEKNIQLKVDSVMKHLNLDSIMGSVDLAQKQLKTLNHFKIMHSKGMGNGNQMIIQLSDSDSVGGTHCKVIHLRSLGDKKIAIADLPGMEFDLDALPQPPMPPHMSKCSPFSFDPFAMNPNDESIVSYDKKDLGNGLEKITIVRKKQKRMPMGMEDDGRPPVKK